MSDYLQAIDLKIGYEASISFGTFSYSVGNLIGLIGNNGTGKTTLLRTLSGFIKPISGEIWFGNKNLQTYTRAELSKIISIVSTTNPDVALLSVEESVSLGRFPYSGQLGSLSVLDTEIVGRAMDQCGVYSLRNRMLNQLSDGERQKVFLAKAIAQDTRVLLLDEPSSFLDLSSKIKLFSLLRRIATEENKLILISSHDVPTLLEFAHLFLLLENSQPWKTVGEFDQVLNWIKSQR